LQSHQVVITCQFARIAARIRSGNQRANDSVAAFVANCLEGERYTYWECVRLGVSRSRLGTRPQISVGLRSCEGASRPCFPHVQIATITPRPVVDTCENIISIVTFQLNYQASGALTRAVARIGCGFKRANNTPGVLITWRPEIETDASWKRVRVIVSGVNCHGARV
jgi:hypothetical protein